MIRKYILQSIK